MSPADRMAQRVLIALLAGLVFVFARPCDADAQPRTSAARNPRAQLALELAAVAANEGALRNRAETALVWQVIEVNGGDTVEERRAFLRRHSGRVLGVKPCTVGNCLWTKELLADPTRVPSKYDAEWWELNRAAAWRDVQRYARRLVNGKEAWRPCSMPPRTWGYAGDMKGALENGLVPLSCEGVLNDGYKQEPTLAKLLLEQFFTPPGRASVDEAVRAVISAREAAGR